MDDIIDITDNEKPSSYVLLWDEPYGDGLKKKVFDTYASDSPSEFHYCYCCKIYNIDEKHYRPFLYNPYGPQTLMNLRPLCSYCAKAFNGECILNIITRIRMCDVDECKNHGYGIIAGSWKCEEHFKASPVHEIIKMEKYLPYYVCHKNDAKMIEEYLNDFQRYIKYRNNTCYYNGCSNTRYEHYSLCKHHLDKTNNFRFKTKLSDSIFGGVTLSKQCYYSYGCKGSAISDSGLCKKHLYKLNIMTEDDDNKDDNFNHLEDTSDDSTKIIIKYNKLKKKYEDMKQENIIINDRLTALEELMKNKLE